MSPVLSFFLIILGSILATVVTALVWLFHWKTENWSPANNLKTRDLNQIQDKENLIRLARRYQNNGKNHKAIKAWDNYLELAPDSMAALAQRGKLYFQEREYEAALEDLEKAVEVADESYPEVYLYLARIYRNRGNVEEALRYYSQYMEVAPENISVVFEVADTARKGRQHEEAIRMYELAREEGIKSLYIEATLKLVELCFTLEKKEKLADYLKDLYELDRKNELSKSASLTARYFHARLLEKEGRSEEAMEKFRQIYLEQPDFKDISSIIQSYIEESEGEMILERILNCSTDKFQEIAKKIVNNMGFKIKRIKNSNEEEIFFVALEESGLWSTERALFGFKQWDFKVGEWPVKEFELKVIDEHYNRGYLVVPGGYSRSALEFVRKSNQVEVIAPGQIIQVIKSFPNLDFVFDDSK